MNTLKDLASRWPGEVAALIAGLILPFAFAPIDIIPIAFLSPAVLFWLWLNSTTKQAVRRGYLFGIGFFAVGMSWIAISMYRFGGMGMPLAAFLTVMFILIWAVLPALLGYCNGRLFAKAKPKIQLLIVLPALWVILEWSRSWLFTGFPWLLLGYSQVDGWLLGFAPIIGTYGVSWIIALSSGLMVLIFTTVGKQRGVFLTIFLSIQICGYLLSIIDWTKPQGDTIRASLLQGNISQIIKWQPKYRHLSIDLYTKMTRDNWQSDLIVWPETALPAFYHQVTEELESLAIEARMNDTDLLIGIAVSDELDSSRYFNSVVALGEETEFYHKRHLVPFGEFLPLKDYLGSLLEFFKIPMANFSSGNNDQSILSVAGTKIGMSICYEDVFGEEIITSLPQANVLVNVSNDAWFGDSYSPHQHLQMARMRSIETGRPMLRGTNNGVSAIIDHHGNLLKVSVQFEEFVLTGVVQPMKGTTPYIVFGNMPIIGVLVFSLGIIVIYQIRRDKIIGYSAV